MEDVDGPILFLTLLMVFMRISSDGRITGPEAILALSTVWLETEVAPEMLSWGDWEERQSLIAPPSLSPSDPGLVSE